MLLRYSYTLFAPFYDVLVAPFTAAARRRSLPLFKHREANVLKTKVSVYVATSLDGFIARKNGDLDWLNRGDDQGDEDYGYLRFMDSVDVLVMGRATFEKVLTFGEWPYRDKRVIVLGANDFKIPDPLPDNVSAISENPTKIVEWLSAEGATHLYIDGGNTIQRFLAAGLVDEMTITRIPVLISDGIPLFGRLDNDMRFKHIETRHFENGLLQSKYRVIMLDHHEERTS